MPATGLTAHRANNLARQLQGLAWSPTPPTPTTVPDNDHILLSGTHDEPLPAPPLLWHIYATWSRGLGAIGPAHCLMVWTSIRTTHSSSSKQGSTFSWLGSTSINPDAPILIDDLLTGCPFVLRGAILNFRFGIAEVGCAPFVRIRAAFRNLQL